MIASMCSAAGTISRRSWLSAVATATLSSAKAQERGLRIWDLHCHLNGFEGSTPSAKAEEMIRLADRMGVERMCVYLGYPFLYDPSPDDLRAQNNQVLEALRVGKERMLGFVYLNPNYLEFSLTEFDECVRDGHGWGEAVGGGAHERARLDPIVDYAQSLKAVIFSIPGTRSAARTPKANPRRWMSRSGAPASERHYYLRTHRRQLGTGNPNHP